MNKTFFLILLFSTTSLLVTAQQTTKIYNPDADAKTEIATAVAKAGIEGKHVFLQIGGNWCPWCVKFHKMVTEDAKLDSLLRANYELVHVNYSKEADNHEILATLGFPQRFGFPVFVILDDKGRVIHIQDSWYLEKDKTYDRDKVEHLFLMWSAYTMKEAAGKYGK
jgi:thioredoxin-related protein